MYWSIARYDLGLSDLEFLETTPRSLDLLIKRLQRREFKEYQIGAKTSAILANVYRDRAAKPQPFTELDFIPEYLWPEELQDSEPSKFDKAGNVEFTDLKSMTAAEQREFLFNCMGKPRKKNVKPKRKPKRKSS